MKKAVDPTKLAKVFNQLPWNFNAHLMHKPV